MLGLQSNAIKYTEKGYIKHIVSLETIDELKYLKVKVVDTGLGIKEEDASKLFKLFGRISND